MDNPQGQNSQIPSADELQKENRSLKRKLALAESNLSRARQVSVSLERTEQIIDLSIEKELQFFKLVLENTINIILLLDFDGRFAYASDTFLRDAGIANYGLISGRHFQDALKVIIPEENLQRIAESIDSAVDKQKTLSLEEQFSFNSSGLLRTYSILITPMTDKESKSTGIMLLFNDITTISEAMEMAQSASTAKTNFLANMSHEIRTPMNAIIGMTSIGKAAVDIERKDYCLKKIEDASKHLLGIINDILDMSKIEANKLELSHTEFGFEEMLKNVINIINFRVEEHRQHFIIYLDENIPRALVGDEQRLAQVITNLLSNAVKFTPEEGSIFLEAQLLSSEDGMCRLQISVEDTGIGVTDEQKARMFHSFEQAEAGTSRKYGGTGLGLAISKSIVEMMDGSIWVESEQGQGAKFIFTVLLKCAPGDHFSRSSDPHPDEATELCDLTGHTLLIAEDVDINREIVLALLEPTNLYVECAENGIEAVRMFECAPDKYDMIFMDVQMPEMDGYEATRRIRAMDLPRAKEIPIVAMTANVFREDVERCLEAGMNDHIGKPIDIDEVLSQTKKWIKRR